MPQAINQFSSRTEQLLGPEAMNILTQTRVILFGVGGVGSWCAEALVRSGVRCLTLVDDDTVQPSNVNRQDMATAHTIGQPKTEAMRNRLLEINPDADIHTIATRYTPQTAEKFCLDDYDFVIDAIDSIPDKLHLIMQATHSTAAFFSSMGAARRTDPTQVAVDDFWKIQGCPLARTLRQRIKAHISQPNFHGSLPHFRCVYSKQPPIDTNAQKSQLGSIVTITATFGLTLASLVINSVTDKAKQ